MSHEDNISLAIEMLNKAAEKPVPHTEGTGGDNARYGCITTSGKPFPNRTEGYGKNFWYQHPCHAYMAHMTDADVVWSMFEVHPSIEPKEAGEYKNFLSYGPWKSFADEEYMLWKNDGFIFPNLDKTPANLLQNFLVATRMIKEWPKFIKVWYRWVTEYGLNPEVAFWFLTVFQAEDSTEYHCIREDRQHHLSFADKYDWPLDVVSSTKESLDNFRAGRYEALNQPFSKSPSYKPVNRIWGENQLEFDKGCCKYIFDKYSDKVGKIVKDTVKQPSLGLYDNAKQTSINQASKTINWKVSWEDIIEIIKEET